jgi:hypothetical protein
MENRSRSLRHPSAGGILWSILAVFSVLAVCIICVITFGSSRSISTFDRASQNPDKPSHSLDDQVAKLKRELSRTTDESAHKLKSVGREVDGAATAAARKADSAVHKAGDALKEKIEENRSAAQRNESNDEVNESSEQSHLEFDLTRGRSPQKVGDVELVLVSADPGHNHFTMEIFADGKRAAMKNGRVNEPMHFYAAGGRVPYEIVVNQVKKDEVTGYLVVQKARAARGADSAQKD